MKWHEKWAENRELFKKGELVWMDQLAGSCPDSFKAKPNALGIWTTCDVCKNEEGRRKMSGVYETVVIEYLHNADVNARIVGGVETVWAESKQQAKDKRMVEHCKGEHNPNLEILCRPFA